MACQTFGIRYSPQINPRAAEIFIEHLTASKVVNGKKMIAVGNTELRSFHRLHWHHKLAELFSQVKKSVKSWQIYMLDGDYDSISSSILSSTICQSHACHCLESQTQTS